MCFLLYNLISFLYYLNKNKDNGWVLVSVTKAIPQCKWFYLSSSDIVQQQLYSWLHILYNTQYLQICYTTINERHFINIIDITQIRRGMDILYTFKCKHWFPVDTWALWAVTIKHIINQSDNHVYTYTLYTIAVCDI